MSKVLRVARIAVIIWAIALAAYWGGVWGFSAFRGKQVGVEEQMKAEIKAAMTKKVKETLPDVSCTNVTLIRKTPNELSGIIEFSDGSKTHITVDENDKEFIWRAD